MVKKVFLNNLRAALKHNKPHFNSIYNNDVLALIKVLIEAGLILNISRGDLLKGNRLIIYIKTKNKEKSAFNIINMSDRKKMRNWPVSVLIKNVHRNHFYILKTIYGYKDSHFCIQKNIGGVTVLKIEC